MLTPSQLFTPSRYLVEDVLALGWQVPELGLPVGIIASVAVRTEALRKSVVSVAK